MNIWTGDFEADGLLDTATKVWCGVFKNHSTGDIVRFHYGSGGNYVYDMLQFMDTVDVLCVHNGIGYDFPLLRKIYGYEFKGQKIDTLLMSRLQRPNRKLPKNCPFNIGPHSVEAWGYRLGKPKIEHHQWDKFTPEMLARCEQDVEIQHDIYLALLKEGKDEGWEDAHKLNMRLFELLQRQEEYGWQVDRGQIDRAIHMLNHWIERIDRAVSPLLPVVVEKLETKKDGEYSYVRKPFKRDGSYSQTVNNYWNDSSYLVVGPYSRIGFRRVDLDSNKEVKEFLLAEGWEPDEWNTNDAGERTSPKLSKTDSFIGIRGGLGRLVAKRVQCKQRRSIIDGWIKVIREDGRIPSVVTGLTVTGRARHTNIVNVPRVGSFFGKWMRKIFIAKPGWVLVGTDSDANHARQLAAKMGDPEFLHAVTAGKKEDGTDMHSLNRRKIGMGTRDQAKIFFYAYLLGAMPQRLSKVLGCSVAEAKLARENFVKNMPALKAVVDRLTEEWRSHAKRRWNPRFNRMEYYGGWFRGLDGRPIFCEHEKDVLGYSLQSDESIHMAAAYSVFHKWMEKEGYRWGEDYGTVCWYHDEFTVECKPEIAPDVAWFAMKSIEWAGNFFKINCPHKGNAQYGLDWAEIH